MVREEMAQLAKVTQELMQLRQSLLSTPPGKVEAYKLTITNDHVRSVETEASASETQNEPPKKERVNIKYPAQTGGVDKHQDSPPFHSHAWISKRIAILENERKSRWEKMKSAVLGK